MSWRSWSDEFIERVVAFHVEHCGVGWFAGWLFGSVVSSLVVVGGWCFTWNMEVCLGWFVGIGCCGFEEWNRVSLTVEWADLSCLRSVDVSRETIPLTQRILLIYLLCFTWNMGNACEGNLLRLRLCFLVFEGFSMFHVKHDVFTTTHLFHVKHCFCFTTSQGCQCVSRET